MGLRRLAAGGTCLALAFTLTACGERDRRDDNGGWFPVFIPWSQPNNYRPAPPPAPAYRAPAPAYRAPAPAPRPPVRTGK